MTTATVASPAEVAVRVEAADRLATGISGGEWVAGAAHRCAGTSAGPRPVQRLVAAGLGGYASLVEPVQHAVDRMVVDGSVAAFTDALQRTGSAVEQVGRDFLGAAQAGEADWTGTAGDRYRERVRVISQALAGVARVLAAGSAAARMMGAAVGSARAQADALLDRCVSELISYVRLASSVQGGNTFDIRAEAASLVASYARPVAALEEMLRQTARQLAGATGPAGGVLTTLREALALPPDPGSAGSASRPPGGPGVAAGDPDLVLASFSGSSGDSGTTTAAGSRSAAETSRGLSGGGDAGGARNVQEANLGNWLNRVRPTSRPGWTPGGRPATPRPGSVGRPVGPPHDRQQVTGRKTEPFNLKKLLETPPNKPSWNRADEKDREKIQEAAEEIHHQLEETFVDLANGMRNEVMHDLPNVRPHYRPEMTDQQIIGAETDKRVGRWIAENHDKLLDPGSGWQLRSQVAQMNPEAEVPWGTDGSRRVDVVLQREIPNPKWAPGSPLPQFGHENVTVYDLKTGEKGIEADWARDVKRKFDPLFEPVEIHPDRGIPDRTTLKGMRLK
ncbi:hypothetical protein BBK82_34715 [Lentzea guizhouensis]|uniref:Uncharacterized protein n=1 Tax=Lentzea guizhouensis TaxID=1586287 RepID=A0A1B2HRT2_9PSEU|nr:hypothetical protein [Lentzea guizhouensis]ANZ40408.1 hypothetical protein BBK82_34715 [Lentzea guizhouensis]